MPIRDEIKRKQWQEKVKTWKESGLSGPAWCRENQEKYHSFKYWREIFKKTDKQQLAFEELKDELSVEANIEIRMRDLTICLPANCNQALFEKCLITLRKFYC